MASSIASYIVLNKDLTTGIDVATEVPFENSEIHVPKQTAVDKIGGILCYICDSTFGNKKDFDSHYATHKTGEIIYTCVACRKQHSGYPSFRNHCYLQHIVKDKFACQQCNKSFSKQTALTAHITAIHDFKCGECDEKFKSKKDLQIHKIIHNKKGREDPPYNCTKCSKVINSIDMCESHIDDHCEILHPCPICATVLPNKEEATQHLTEHFDEKITPDMAKPTASMEDSSIDTLGGILCSHCDMLFKNRAEIDAHFALEHEDKVIVYSCNICEKQYTKYSLFGDHCYFHITKDKFQCEQCNRLFPRLPLLVLHALSHGAGAGERPHACDRCAFACRTHYRLLAHKRHLHHERAVKCHVPACDATFNTPKELTLHQRAHKSCLDNWCRQCGLQFATLRACARHLDVHRRKLYACPVCARTYRERYLLLKHLPQHFESVLHICKVCGRSYSARNRLIQHTKTHSEAKKHACRYCGKAFARQYLLEQHERVHTGAKPYRCTVCQKDFASYPNWTKHLTRAHAFDKTMIKQVREARKLTESSPVKAESGIGSGSEISDVYGFASDDSDNYPIKKIKRENGPSNEETSSSLTDTVNAVIERIDEDIDLMNPQDLGQDLNDTDFTDFNVDDSSDIKAIVEHIDALSGDLNMTPPSQVPMNELMPFDLIPEDTVYNPEYAAPVEQLAEQYYQPTSVPLEYGPDFNTLGSDAYTDVLNLNDHVLPHIDPLLTIKAEQNAKIFVQNVQNLQNNIYINDPNPVDDQNWQPIIKKVFSYDESNDNRMYVLNGNMF